MDRDEIGQGAQQASPDGGLGRYGQLGRVLSPLLGHVEREAELAGLSKDARVGRHLVPAREKLWKKMKMLLYLFYVPVKIKYIR